MSAHKKKKKKSFSLFLVKALKVPKGFSKLSPDSSLLHGWTVSTFSACLYRRNVPAFSPSSWPFSGLSPAAPCPSCGDPIDGYNSPGEVPRGQNRGAELSPCPAAYSALEAAQDVFGPLAFKSASLAQGQLFIHENLHILLCRAALKSLSLVSCLGFPWPRCSTLHLDLLNFLRATDSVCSFLWKVQHAAHRVNKKRPCKLRCNHNSNPVCGELTNNNSYELTKQPWNYLASHFQREWTFGPILIHRPCAFLYSRSK